MKILRKQPIFSMSYTRKKALDILYSYSDNINDHILKCIIYKDTKPNDVKHWIVEICSWLHRADNVTSKTKLKPRDYEDTIFSAFGNSIVDARINLENFYDKFVKFSSTPYPKFEVTSSLVNDTFEVYERIKDFSIKQFLKSNKLSTDEWYHEIYKLINL